MFCKFCGAQIDDNSVFCQRCGKPTTDNGVKQNKPTQPSSVKLQDKNVYNSPVIKRQNYRSSALGGQIFAVILFIIMFAIEFALVVSDPGPFSQWKSSDEEMMKVLLRILMVGDFICAVISLIKIVPIRNSFVCVTEDGVYGSGGSPLYFATKPFSLSYQEITDVKVYSGGVIIERGGDIYKCAIDNETEIAKLIRTKIEQNQFWECIHCGTKNNQGETCSVCGRSKVVSSHRKMSSNSWTCPTCGTINTTYTGTCGCGTRKP